LRVISPPVTFSKEISVTATFCLLLHHWLRCGKESPTSSSTSLSIASKEFIKFWLFKEVLQFRWLLMTTSRFLLTPTDQSSAKLLEDKSGSCYSKKHGLRSRDLMELSVLDALMRSFKLSQLVLAIIIRSTKTLALSILTKFGTTLLMLLKKSCLLWPEQKQKLL